MATFQSLLEEIEGHLSRTPRFVSAAFHIHSPASHDWAQRPIADRDRNERQRFLTNGGCAAFLDELAKEFEVVCITDHMKSEFACSLSHEAVSRGDILVLPGMEVSLHIPPFQEHIHVLAIFPPGKHASTVERIFDNGFPAEAERNGKEVFQLPGTLRAWVEGVEGEGGIVVLAHIDGSQGHRKVVRDACEGALRSFLVDSEGRIAPEDRAGISNDYANVLGPSGVHAVEILKPEAKQHYVSFAHNGGKQCRMPCVMRSDAHCFEEFSRPACKTYLKIARRDFDAIRDALSFFETRVRFADDLPTEPTPRILGIRLTAPQGNGLFTQSTIAFNQNLNCVIGPRGSGKSTIIEALRYILGLNATCGRTAHMGKDHDFSKMARKIQAANLHGTVIELLYRTDEGDPQCLTATFEPSTDVATEVWDLEGNPKHLAEEGLRDTFPARVYSWGEIETLGRQAELQRDLIDCLIPDLGSDCQLRDRIRARLAANRAQITTKCVELGNTLSEQQGLLRRYCEFKTQFELSNTEEVKLLFEDLDKAREKLQVLRKIREAVVGQIGRVLAIQADGINELEVDLIGGASQNVREWWLDDVSPALDLETLEGDLNTTIAALLGQLNARRTVLDELIKGVELEESRCEARLREKTQADANEELKRSRREQSRQRYEQVVVRRNRYLSQWEELQELLRERAGLLDALDETQQRISSSRGTSREQLTIKLDELKTMGLPISIAFKVGGDRGKLVEFMRDNRLLNRSDFGNYKDKKFAERCASMASPPQVGRAILARAPEMLESEGSKFGTSDVLQKSEGELLVNHFHPFGVDEAADVNTVDRAKLEQVMLLTEVPWDDEIRILLDGEPVDQLSPGQRSSAMLPLVALAETVPLIIDQPEDNLDNRLVGNVLTGILADLKERRQIIVATHNPNIVVGGDAEQVIVVEATHAHRAQVKHTGSVDDPEIVQSILGIMEGGKDAFEARSRRYRIGH